MEIDGRGQGEEWRRINNLLIQQKRQKVWQFQKKDVHLQRKQE